MKKKESVNNVTELYEKGTIRFAMQKHTYNKTVKGGEITINTAIIVLKNNETGKVIVHPFSGFLIESFSDTAIKSRITYGEKLTPFLNYILDNSKRFKINRFEELEFFHASEFLNYHCGALARKTYNYYKGILMKFYYYLAKKGVLRNISIYEFKIYNYITKTGKVGERVEAPFPDLQIPESESTSRNSHDLPYELQALFLDIAYEEVNRIALGVAFEMFGGLRLSEVVRLRYSLISTFGDSGENGIILNLNEDDEGTRPELKNNGALGYVKRPRIQKVFSPFGLLGKLMKQHRIRYKAVDGSDAIFINSDGLPMSYGSYRYYFNKLKRIFLQRLRESDNPILKAQALVLEGKRWSTHILRGIFSNTIIEIIDNPVEAQVLRGDKNPSSIQVYIADSKRLSKKYEENTEDTYVNLLNKLNGKEET